jgi:Glycosyltransferase sugar-binding region containing DXD motif
VSSGRQLIPRTFHQIWVGADPYPDAFAEYARGWRELHPDWELRLWTEATIPDGIPRHEVYETLRNPSERSDVLRYELLHRFGGVYLDCDLECRGSIEPLLEGLDFVVAAHPAGGADVAVVGAVAGHPLLVRAREELRPRTSYGPTVDEGTGGAFLDRVLSACPGIEPVNGIVGPNGPAVHHFDRSHREADSLREAVRDTYRRLLLATEDARQWKRKAEEAEALLGQTTAGARAVSALDD